MANRRVRLTGTTVRNSHYSPLSVFVFDKLFVVTCFVLCSPFLVKGVRKYYSQS